MSANAGFALMSPFMAATPPAPAAPPEPVREQMRPTSNHFELSDHGFESLTTRLLALDQNKKLN
jgi:hypothetical protein